MTAQTSLQAVAPPDPGSESFAFMLADVVRLMRSDFRRRATGLRLTPALSRLIYYVDQKPGCSQAELAAWLDVTSVTVGRMIDRLEGCGFVRRLADAHDRRTFRIHLDKAARPVVARMHEVLGLTTAQAMQGITRPDFAAFLRVLQRIHSNLSTTDA